MCIWLYYNHCNWYLVWFWLIYFPLLWVKYIVLTTNLTCFLTLVYSSLACSFQQHENSPTGPQKAFIQQLSLHSHIKQGVPVAQQDSTTSTTAPFSVGGTCCGFFFVTKWRRRRRGVCVAPFSAATITFAEREGRRPAPRSGEEEAGSAPSANRSSSNRPAPTRATIRPKGPTGRPHRQLRRHRGSWQDGRPDGNCSVVVFVHNRKVLIQHHFFFRARLHRRHRRCCLCNHNKHNKILNERWKQKEGGIEASKGTVTKKTKRGIRERKKKPNKKPWSVFLLFEPTFYYLYYVVASNTTTKDVTFDRLGTAAGLRVKNDIQYDIGFVHRAQHFIIQGRGLLGFVPLNPDCRICVRLLVTGKSTVRVFP